nr:MAG TPA: hypothetical protein [Caudoviricetes sp.]
MIAYDSYLSYMNTYEWLKVVRFRPGPPFDEM